METMDSFLELGDGGGDGLIIKENHEGFGEGIKIDLYLKFGGGYMILHLSKLNKLYTIISKFYVK